MEPTSRTNFRVARIKKTQTNKRETRSPVYVLLCEFNIHHNDWVLHSKQSDIEGRFYRVFSVGYGLTQIILKYTRVPDTTEDHAIFLDLFLTPGSDKCPSKFLPPLGSVQINAKPKVSADVPFNKTIFTCAKVDWVRFRSHMMAAHLNFFRNAASKTAALFADWIHSGMQIFIPKNFRQQSNSRP